MASSQPPGDTPPILVIDDEEVVRLLFQSLLEDEGYQTILAETGQRGIQLLDQHCPPLALVDKNLPDISGLDLIADQKKRHPDTEFIMITGYASLDSAVKAMEMGAFSYLTKPFADMDTVLDRIRAALEVNSLRLETSQLRNRLKDLGTKASPAAESAQPAAAPPRTTKTADLAEPIREQLGRTLRFLESFLDKRDQPPNEALWARMVDMLEEETRRLKELLKADDSQQG
jgi:DNA-binding NtrC family response regulator